MSEFGPQYGPQTVRLHANAGEHQPGQSPLTSRLIDTPTPIEILPSQTLSGTPHHVDMGPAVPSYIRFCSSDDVHPKLMKLNPTAETAEALSTTKAVGLTALRIWMSFVTPALL